ncbi:MAG: hypothetical protein C4519_25155 [Desulfobacteraceae bacterium]|nr:MAG: hypothetical protein C4519_25155 [Desulfobacteraceae bacterium]
MKKVFWVLLCITLIPFLCTPAFAVMYHFDDNTINWPGSFSTMPGDINGTPVISGMDVYVNDATGDLQKIEISMTGRRVYDGLFINTSSTGGINGFDYYIRDDRMDNSGHTVYDISGGYSFTYATSGRVGHQNGIADLALKPIVNDLLSSLIWDSTNSLLIYTFSGGINVGNSFIIGYTPDCANDVILTPEPSVALFLGSLFLGLGVLGRRRFLKR